MSGIGRMSRATLLALAVAVLAACTIPSLETLSRRSSSVSATPASVTVRSGDTVYGIARRYRRSPQAVIDANGLRPPYTVWPGQVLRLPSGRGHRVRRGDSLSAISRRYDLTVADLARANGLRPPYTIYVGQILAIPSPAPTQMAAAATVSPRSAAAAPSRTVTSPQPSQVVSPRSGPPLPPRRPDRRQPARTTSSGDPIPPRPPQLEAARAREAVLVAIPAPQARSASGFQWPLSGAVLSGFGAKADGRHNDGVNIAAEAGSPVVAADNGVVAYAGNELRGYGNLILIRHDDDWVTAYGHAEQILVRRGDRVRAGQRIATVGTSGGVGTPQLHFEIRREAVAVDPLAHLPPAPL